jgi:hypothetical protein
VSDLTTSSHPVHTGHGAERDGRVADILEELMNERGSEAKSAPCFGCGKPLEPKDRSSHLGPDGPHGKIQSK